VAQYGYVFQFICLFLENTFFCNVNSRLTTLNFFANQKVPAAMPPLPINHKVDLLTFVNLLMLNLQ